MENVQCVGSQQWLIGDFELSHYYPLKNSGSNIPQFESWIIFKIQGHVGERSPRGDPVRMWPSDAMRQSGGSNS